MSWGRAFCWLTSEFTLRVCVGRGCQVIAKMLESERHLSLGICQLTCYITTIDVCLFESLIHKIKAKLLETFYGTFTTQALLTLHGIQEVFQ